MAAETAVDCFVETAVGFVGTAVGFAGTDLELAGTVSLGIGIAAHVAAEAECFVGTVVCFAGTVENSAVETYLVALPGIEELGIALVVVEAEIDELRLAEADYSELSGPKDNDIAFMICRVFPPGLFS